ncbi:LysR family transcriptional regulator [Bordetella genomosp. 1]|uniref:LysR family transcriptional regulator n=1 Tax=Bordetella genomosp. 1 TaxID=1395607 RepID=A0A261SGI4_9BORD|nr:LysR family transcriptional regulator [Bordetella genomosp. 1]OZI36171.1 LysR family transcriptional regulator [Bordetella genomosp. 1]OZI58868.1 LysR family transcriptional regulator [Bordetella genomosp. 1]
MNTRFVEAFLWSARLGSFRAASDRLHITQAAVANRIASLEEDIGARLFERDSKELRLTAVGTRLLDYGERLLELRQQILSLGRSGDEVFGLVRIGAIETVVHTWLIGFLTNLRSTYPGIEVQLTSETTRALHRGLREGSLDIALQTDAVTEAGAVNLPCLPMEMGWVGPAGGEESATVEELLRVPVLTMSPGSQPHEALKNLYRDAGMPLGKVHCVSSISALARLVRSNFGRALVPLPPIYEYVARGELQILRTDAVVPPQRLVVSYLEGASSDAIRLVAELACRASDQFTTSVQPPPLGSAQ